VWRYIIYTASAICGVSPNTQDWNLWTMRFLTHREDLYDVTDSPRLSIALSKVEVKFSLCLNNQVLRNDSVRGSGCIDPRFLDFGISWKWVVSFTPRPLYPLGKSLRYPLDRRLGGPQSRSGRRGKDKVFDSNRTRTPTPPSSSP
jgi:hypothetical protein